MNDCFHLIGCTTPNYVARANDWLETVGVVKQCIPHVVLVDFNSTTDKDRQIEKSLKSTYKNINFHKLDLPESHSHFMIQGGEFLDAIPDLYDTDLVCLTDMDLFFQRDFAPEELVYLYNELGYGNSIGVWHNGGFTDTLAQEARRIDLDTTSKYCDYRTFKTPCMNCGVMIATAECFNKIRQLYEKEYKEFYKATAHRSRSQFLLNWCWSQLGIEVRVLPGQIHQHGHFGYYKGYSYVNNKYMFEDKEVMMVHKFKR